MKTLKILALAIVVFGLFNCTGTHDELWINADGSGKYESTTDLSQMYPFLMMGMEMEKNKSEGEADSPETKFLSMLTREKLDTIIELSSFASEFNEEEGQSFDELFEQLKMEMAADGEVPDSIRNSMTKLFDYILGMQLRFQLDQREKSLKIGSIFEFEDFDFLQNLEKDYMNMIKYAQQMDEMEEETPEFGAAQLNALESAFNNIPQFSIEGNYFRYQQRGYNMMDFMDEEGPEFMQMLSMFTAGQEDYKLYVHLPGKIKKINASNEFVEKIDKQTILIKTSLKDLYDPNYEFDLEVKFKPKKK